MDCSEYILRGPEVSTHLPTFKLNTSVLDVFFECMKNNGNDIAQIDAETGKRITYEELYRISTSIASNLIQRYEITRGDIVPLCTEIGIDSYCMMFGVIFTGATAALLSPKLKQDDFRQLMFEIKPKVTYCSKDVQPGSKAIAADVSHVIVANAERHGTSYVDYSSLLKSQDTSFRPFQVTDITKHTPVLLFSSGTTGQPKGILLTNIGLQRLAYIFCRNDINTFISISSFVWISSLATAISGLVKKHKVIWSPAEMEKLLEYTEQYKVDTWMLTPGRISELLKHPALHKYSISSLRYIFVGGAVLANCLRTEFVETVCKNRIAVINLYGMSETGILTGRFDNEDVINVSRPDSSGRLLSGIELKIIDESGKAVGPNFDGELLVKSIATMAGYWAPQNIHSPIDSAGWFHTGDIGHFDSDGYIYLTGRKKDIVLVKNTKVSLQEVEALIVLHPDVQEATVLAKPHPLDTNHLIAFVVRKADALHLTEKDVITFVEDHVEDAKRLRGGVIFLDTIPKTLSGKINQHVLYNRIMN